MLTLCVVLAAARAWRSWRDRHQLVGALLLFGLALSGCDLAGSGAEPGYIEGTFTLPDGTTKLFRNEAESRVFLYSGLGTSDVFTFGSRNTGVPLATGEIRVLIRFAQNGLTPQSGTFSTEIGPPSPPRISVTATVWPVEGVAPSYPTSDSTIAILLYPPGTVTVRVIDNRIEGEFDVEGPPNTAIGDDRPEKIRLEGRFSIPYEPYVDR